MNKLLSVLAFVFLFAICLHITLVDSAQADGVVVMIDDFQAGDYTLGREGTTIPYTVSSTQYDGSGIHIIGGQRDVTFQKLSGSSTQPYANVISTASYLGYDGFSTFNSSFSCNAVWTMTYGLGGDLDLDLSVGGLAERISLIVDGDHDDSVPVRPLPFTITVVSGTGTASVTKNIVTDGLQSYNFTEFAGVDFTDVDRIIFEFVQNSATNDAVDFALFQLYAGAETVPVEETSWGKLKSLYEKE